MLGVRKAFLEDVEEKMRSRLLGCWDRKACLAYL